MLIGQIWDNFYTYSQRSPLVAVWSEALVYRKVGRASIPASSVLRV